MLVNKKLLIDLRGDSFLSNPQLSHNSAQPNITLSWVRHENYFAHHHHHHKNSMSAISQLLLTRFWWNFKGRFLWTFRTESNCQGDICPCNICPRNICPYQQYLSCYWADFDQSFWTQFFGALIFIDHNFFGPNFFRLKYFLDQKVFGPKIFSLQIFFWPKFFWTRFFSDLNPLYPQFFWQKETAGNVVIRRK